MRRLPLLVFAAALGLGAVGCWMQGWLDFFAITSVSDAFRVRDLRVLSVRADPPGVLVDPRVLLADEGDPLLDALPDQQLEVVVDAFDPRGGVATIEVQLCPAEQGLDFFALLDFGLGDLDLGTRTLADIIQSCASLPLDEPPLDHPEVRAALAPRPGAWAANPTEDDPFGRLGDPLTERYTLTPRALRAMAELVPGGLRDFNGGRLHVVARVSRPVDGEVESEAAVLPLSFRMDLTHPSMPEDALGPILDEAGGKVCSDALLRDCVGVGDPPPGCGNLVQEEGEECDPPEPRFCNLSCELIDDGCFDLDNCLLPMSPNQPPALRGLQVVAPPAEVPTGAPLPLGATVQVPLGEEVRVAALFDRQSLEIYQVSDLSYRPDPAELLDGPEEAPPGGQADGGAAGDVVRRVQQRVESPCTMFYLARDEGELQTTRGDSYEASFCAGFDLRPEVVFVPPSRRAAGDTDVLRLTANDGRGGMIQGTLTLRYE